MIQWLSRRSYTTAKNYRDAMRNVGSTVCVITCQASTGEKGGMTISSFCSVSLNPTPIVSFNIQVPSRTSHLLKACGGVFAVNVLESSTENIRLAQAFAGWKGHEYNPFKAYESMFEELEGVPSIKKSTSLFCEIIDQVEVQDHNLILARVNKVKYRGTKPMIYLNGGFHNVGNSLANS